MSAQENRIQTLIEIAADYAAEGERVPLSVMTRLDAEGYDLNALEDDINTTLNS